MADIENQIAASERESKAQLRLRVIENEDKVLAELMKARGYAVITHADLDALSDLVAAKTDNEYAVSEAREAGYQAAAAKFGAENRDLVSQHKVELAEHKAQATAKNQRISDLEAQVAELRGQLPQSVKPVSKSLAPTLVARVLWLTPVRTNHGVASSEATV
ncbi:hypothetical protein [Klebsiella quasipneumoniae]|uniref:hypothetical protein n=1 Tax=Klebsiella quasipneumoniae TaxID=1463165 RepID=UPI0029652937|nr:hypothetical protein [Klebsiella quasipneumoniae]